MISESEVPNPTSTSISPVPGFERFVRTLRPGQIALGLFEALPDVLFWIKNRQSRFVFLHARLHQREAHESHGLPEVLQGEPLAPAVPVSSTPAWLSPEGAPPSPLPAFWPFTPSPPGGA